MPKKPKKCISVEDAKKLEANYVSIIEKNQSRSLGEEECREFWWPLEEIEEYIAYVKDEAAKKGYKNLGLRFYLGKYEGKKRQTTLFIAPTRKGEEKKRGFGENNENCYDIPPFNGGFGGIPPKNY